MLSLIKNYFTRYLIYIKKLIFTILLTGFMSMDNTDGARFLQ